MLEFGGSLLVLSGVPKDFLNRSFPATFSSDPLMGVEVFDTVPIWLRLAPWLRELPLLRWDNASNWKIKRLLSILSLEVFI